MHCEMSGEIKHYPLYEISCIRICVKHFIGSHICCNLSYHFLSNTVVDWDGANLQAHLHIMFVSNEKNALIHYLKRGNLIAQTMIQTSELTKISTLHLLIWFVLRGFSFNSLCCANTI